MSKTMDANKGNGRKSIRKWLMRAACVLLIVLSVPVILFLNPTLLYAHHTVHDRFVIYHNTPLDPAFAGHLDNVIRLLDKCELADPSLQMDVCLNDGSKYPALLGSVLGPALARSAYNKIVLWGAVDWQRNCAEFPHCKWNLEQLLTHEATHCLQLNKFGILNWRPLAAHPFWKEEGYAEYVARQHPDQTDLAANILRLQETERKGEPRWVTFADGMVVDIPYYKHWLLTQYCLDVKGMTFVQLLDDQTSDAAVQAEMMEWYQAKR